MGMDIVVVVVVVCAVCVPVCLQAAVLYVLYVRCCTGVLLILVVSAFAQERSRDKCNTHADGSPSAKDGNEHRSGDKKPQRKHRLRRNETVIARKLQAMPTFPVAYFTRFMSLVHAIVCVVLVLDAYYLSTNQYVVRCCGQTLVWGRAHSMPMKMGRVWPASANAGVHHRCDWGLPLGGYLQHCSLRQLHGCLHQAAGRDQPVDRPNTGVSYSSGRAVSAMHARERGEGALCGRSCAPKFVLVSVC